MREILVRYEDLHDAAQDIHKAGEYLDHTTIPMVQKVVNTFQQGGLEGKAAEAFIGGLSQTFVPAIGRLRDKLFEVATDIEQNAATMQDSDSKGAKGFG